MHIKAYIEEKVKIEMNPGFVVGRVGVGRGVVGDTVGKEWEGAGWTFFYGKLWLDRFTDFTGQSIKNDGTIQVVRYSDVSFETWFVIP